MALPSDKSELDSNFVDYVNRLVEDPAKNNSEKLRTVVCFFDGQPPRVYHVPGSRFSDHGSESINFNTPATSLVRFDHVSAVVFQQNPTCQWIIINGSHRRICL
jgi:hypothetical protein